MISYFHEEALTPCHMSYDVCLQGHCFSTRENFYVPLVAHLQALGLASLLDHAIGYKAATSMVIAE